MPGEIEDVSSVEEYLDTMIGEEIELSYSSDETRDKVTLLEVFDDAKHGLHLIVRVDNGRQFLKPYSKIREILIPEGCEVKED